MLILTILALISMFLMGAMLFVECKIVEDLPEDNEFKKWWRKNIIAPHPKD
jgi:hypothetical protein